MADMSKLVDLALLGKFKEKQDALFQAKLDEKEPLGTAAKLVGDLKNIGAVSYDTATAALKDVNTALKMILGNNQDASGLWTDYFNGSSIAETLNSLKESYEKNIQSIQQSQSIDWGTALLYAYKVINVSDDGGLLKSLTTDKKDTLVNAINEVDANADAAKAAADAAQKTADANTKKIEAITGTGADSIDKKIETAVKTVTDSIGDKTTLTTDEKGTIVGAINEVDANVDALKTSSAVTVDFDDTSRIYKISQGGTLLGTMNIGKDLVVSSGEVKEVAEKGTCLVLTLTSGDVVEIPVASLIEIYTAASGAKEVQIAIDATTRVVSATLVDGGVATAKIADLAVTKAKLAQAVQGSLDKADSAVQKADVTTGSAVGTISVQKADVAVNGFVDLKSAVDTLKGDATTAGSIAKDIADAKAEIKTTTDALDDRAKALEDWKASVGVATDDDLDDLFA